MGHWRKQEISLCLTSQCNLNCGSCYMPKLDVKPEHQTIDVEFAEAGIRQFFLTNQSRTIRFFASGEPTQAFSTMVEIFKRAKKLAGETLTVELQTNGCFNGKVAEWIEKNVNIMWILPADRK